VDEDLTAERALEHLRAYGLTVTVLVAPHPGMQDGWVRLEAGGAEHSYRMRILSEDILATVDRSALQDDGILVAARPVTDRAADELRRRGVNYVDLAGNAFVTFGSTLIDVRGRRSTAARDPRGGEATNLFSPKRAQVVFALLCWDYLARRTVVELAAAGGVSYGQAHGTVAVLRDAGYVAGDDHPRINRKVELLDRWVAAYPQGLGRTLKLASYAGHVGEHLNKVDPDEPIFVSGEWATGEWADKHLMRPTTMTLYVNELDNRLAIRNRWRSDGSPNIFIRKKFWHAPDRSDGPLGGVRNAPWQLVFADLVASGDPRQFVAAQELRNAHAQD
jgi:hypothetical protein